MSVKTSIGQWCTAAYRTESDLYLSLTKVNKVLQIDVISVVGDGIADDFSHFISSLDNEWNES